MSRVESPEHGKKIGYSVLAVWLLGSSSSLIIYGVTAAQGARR